MKNFLSVHISLSKANANTYKRNSQSGFSIVELLIVSGVLGGMALAIAKLTVDMQKFQKNTLSTSEANEFSSAIGYYLNQNCQLELQGKEFPFGGPEDLTLTQYGAWGDMSLPEIKAGAEFEDKWRVKELTWEYKSSIPIKKYKRSGQDLKVAVARIVLEMEILQANNALSLDHYSIEIPFIIEEGTDIVKDCLAGSLGPTGVDMCETMGAEYNPLMDTCIPKKHCFLVTQHINCTSNKGWNPVHSPQSPCEQLILPHISLSGKKQYFNFYHNDSGGSLGDCPPGTKTIFTGNITKMGTLSCGVGCTNTYVSEAKIYLCIKCDIP